MEKLTLSGNRGKNPNAGNCCLFLVGIKKNALPAQRISNYIFNPFLTAFLQQTVQAKLYLICE